MPDQTLTGTWTQFHGVWKLVLTVESITRLSLVDYGVEMEKGGSLKAIPLTLGIQGSVILSVGLEDSVIGNYA